MLSKAALTELLKKHKYSDADIAEMTGTAEVGLKPSSVTIFDETELTTLKENVKRGATEAALDIKAKELKAKYGIEDSTKDIEAIMEKHAEKKLKETGATPDAKVAEYEEKIKNLQSTIDAKEAEKAQIEGRYKEREINDTYRSFLHPDRNPALTDDEWVNRLKSHYEIVDKDGVIGLKDKTTGKVINDKKENLRPAKEVMEETFKAKPEWMKSAPVETPAPEKKITLAPNKIAGKMGTTGMSMAQIAEKVQTELGTTKGTAARQMFNKLVAENNPAA